MFPRLSAIFRSTDVSEQHVEQFYAGSLFLTKSANSSHVIHSKNEMNEDCDGAEVEEDLLENFFKI